MWRHKSEHVSAHFRPILNKFQILNHLPRHDPMGENVSHYSPFKSPIYYAQFFILFSHKLYTIIRLYVHMEKALITFWAMQWREYCKGFFAIICVTDLRELFTIRFVNQHGFIARKWDCALSATALSGTVPGVLSFYFIFYKFYLTSQTR